MWCSAQDAALPIHIPHPIPHPVAHPRASRNLFSGEKVRVHHCTTPLSAELRRGIACSPRRVFHSVGTALCLRLWDRAEPAWLSFPRQRKDFCVDDLPSGGCQWRSCSQITILLQLFQYSSPCGQSILELKWLCSSIITLQ